jgi:hypothetical protein
MGGTPPANTVHGRTMTIGVGMQDVIVFEVLA